MMNTTTAYAPTNNVITFPVARQQFSGPVDLIVEEYHYWDNGPEFELPMWCGPCVLDDESDAAA
jgi:hypothetical protein